MTSKQGEIHEPNFYFDTRPDCAIIFIIHLLPLHNFCVHCSRRPFHHLQFASTFVACSDCPYCTAWYCPPARYPKGAPSLSIPSRLL
ncbi:hypothetical protein ACMFMG_012238 [Clarireedia jacksonii]